MQSFWHPLATHKPSPNYWTDRLGYDMTQPSWVTLHTMVCCEASAWGRFQQASQQASSTYGVKLDGALIQYVDEKDGPWTNGTSSGTGDNRQSITIEHEDCGDYNGPRTPALYRTSALLVRDICQRYQIPIDRQHVIKHNECSNSSTACPDSLDVDRIVRMAAGLETIPGGEGGPIPMTANERNDLGRALIRLAYLVGRHDEPESGAVLDGWLAAVNKNGFEATMVQMFDSGEFNVKNTQLRALMTEYAKVGSLLGQPGPQGTPGTPGAPGESGVTDEHIAEQAKKAIKGAL